IEPSVRQAQQWHLHAFGAVVGGRPGLPQRHTRAMRTPARKRRTSSAPTLRRNRNHQAHRREVAPTDGFGDWNVYWEEWLEGRSLRRLGSRDYSARLVVRP